MFGWFAGLFAKPAPPTRIFNWGQRRPRLYLGIGSRVPDDNVLECIAVLRGGTKILGSNRNTPEVCPICEAELGSWDVGKYGFIWVHRGEHYLVVHDLWIPELGMLLYEAREAAKRA